MTKYLICFLLMGSCYAYEDHYRQHHNNIYWGNSIYSHANTSNYISSLTYNVGHMNYNNPTAQTDKTMLDYTNYNSFSR